MSHLNFWILGFSTNFCPIKTDLSGNTVWPQASVFPKNSPNWPFWAFSINFCSTQNVEWDFFLWFSNTVCYHQAWITVIPHLFCKWLSKNHLLKLLCVTNAVGLPVAGFVLQWLLVAHRNRGRADPQRPWFLPWCSSVHYDECDCWKDGCPLGCHHHWDERCLSEVAEGCCKNQNNPSTYV